MIDHLAVGVNWRGRLCVDAQPGAMNFMDTGVLDIVALFWFHGLGKNFEDFETFRHLAINEREHPIERIGVGYGVEDSASAGIVSDRH